MMSKRITIKLPSSKSISNRLLMMKQWSGLDVELSNLSTSSDTQLLIQLMKDVNAGVRRLHIKDAGTVCRFMMAYCASQDQEEFILEGSDRMHERPQMDLIIALRELGATIECLEKEGFLPLHITGNTFKSSYVSVNGSISSQFISALCLVAPTLTNGLRIQIQGEMVSKPYIHMTLKLMEYAGIKSTFLQNVIEIPSEPYLLKKRVVEADWSSAGFFYAAMIIKPTLHLFLSTLLPSGLQADECIIDLAKDFGIETILHENGCELRSIDQTQIPSSIDFTNAPDLAIPIIVAMALRFPHVTIIGFHHLKYKESDRIQALRIELEKANIHLIEENGILSFRNQFKARETIFFESYHDHRIVMALNLFRLMDVKPIFSETSCVEKSFPNYFQEFDKLFR